MRRLALLFLLTAYFSVAGWSRDLPRYALILSDPAPIKARAEGGQAAVDAARTKVLTAQAAVRNELNARGIRITGSAHTLINAIFVAAEPGVAARLTSIDGVVQVARLKRFRPTLDHAVQLINVSAAYNLIGGASNAGAGIKIGMIDTGIEATHAAFQDSSLTPPAGFPICAVNFGSAPAPQWVDCTATDATKGFPICPSLLNCAYTNNKVIVARSYVPILNSGDPTTSTPDDYSPRDRMGHGTATAMAAAGVTNTGPADTITGVAPKAFLGSYKVFGSPGVNNFASGDAIIEAVEDAFNDGMDIASLSLGGPALTGPLDTGRACGAGTGQVCDVEATVVQEAVTMGMIVVVAAGNSGETGLLSTAALNTMASPADAPNAIAVAATTNSHNWGDPVTVTGLGSYLGQFGTGPMPTAALTGPLGDIANVGDPLGCTAPPAGSLRGLIALVGRGTCTFLQKIQSLETAGAAGAIVYNNPGDDTLVVMSGLNGTTIIPAIFIGYDNGQTIRTYLAGNPQATVSISPNLSAINDTTYNQVAPFSSHGPVLGSAALKPDVAAVGVDLYLAGESYDPNGELFSANGYLVSQGTSFSAPQVAGIAALVKQQNPTLSAIQIRSSVINTATQSLTENGSAASVLAVGAGLPNAAFAVANNLIATPTNASFGVIKADGLPVTVSFLLTNIGTTTLNLSLSINRRTAETTAHTSINLPNLTLLPGQTSILDNLTLMLSGTTPAPGIYEGFVTITGASNPVNIPYFYVVGDGVPNNLISIAGSGDDGTVGQQSEGGYIILRIIDQYGVPIPGKPVTFSVTAGGGQLTQLCVTVCAQANDTDNYGTAAAELFLGPNPGSNVYTATAGGLTASFTATGIAQPIISANGAVNAANGMNQPLAPGSYISLYGTNFAPSTSVYSTPYLPISLNSVSVSFDTPNISVPGHIVFVSAGQLNVQVPWELQGQTAVQIKVSNGDSHGLVYTTPLGAYSPALFEIPSGGQSIAAALDENNNVVTTSNPVARGHVVQLFANGLGPVNNQPASGDPAPSNPLATTTTTPIVTIGGMNAQVMFNGMTPGNAALYQVNAVVPNTSAGLEPITISIGSVVSPGVLIPVQ
jgi:minor extracellular serine protease Vpr